MPNLDFSGWYDYCGGTMAHLKLMQQHARTDVARDQTKLIITPGNHGGTGKRKLGEIDYGPQAEFDKNDIMLRWFALLASGRGQRHGSRAGLQVFRHGFARMEVSRYLAARWDNRNSLLSAQQRRS